MTLTWKANTGSQLYYTNLSLASFTTLALCSPSTLHAGVVGKTHALSLNPNFTTYSLCDYKQVI